MSISVRRKVLVVEDDQDIREALAELLGMEGYDVVQAANGQVALQALSDMEQPCLVLLDLMMPVMDGHEFLARLSTLGVLPTLPVLVLTANRGVEAPPGTVGLMRKPMEMNDLLAAVARYCPPVEAP